MNAPESLGPPARDGRFRAAAGHAAVTLFVLWMLAPLLRCGGGCFAVAPDHATPGAILSIGDQRLNSWILAWDVRAIRRGDTAIFDAPAFFPARGALAGSEHLIGAALPLVPLSWWNDDAVFLHQAATVASFVVLANGAFALIRALTGSAAGGIAAAVLAAFLPWRLAEVAHVQLLGVQWLPFVLLGVVRALGGRLGRARAAGLFAATALQLLSSFYLAYFVTLVLAAVAAASVVTGAVRRSCASLRRGVVAVAAGYVPFVASALPYLGRRLDDDLTTLAALPPGLGAGELARRYLAPGWSSLDWPGVADLAYQVPLPALALAAIGVVATVRRRADSADGHAARALAIGLVAAAAVAALLSLGNDAPGAYGPRLLADLLRDFVPGYANLRGYPRWLLVASWSTALLAGLGAAAASRLGAGPRRAAALAACALAVAFSIPWMRPEVREAWAPLAGMDAALDVVRRGPDGVVLHAPWRSRPRDLVDAESRFLLAQTRHWKSMPNGETAYAPRASWLLREIGDLLPAPEAADALVRLVGVERIVVHRNLVESPAELDAWRALGRREGAAVAYEDDAALVIDLGPAAPPDAAARDRWTRPDPALTATGVARAPVAGEAKAGAFRIVEAGACRRRDARRWASRVVVEIRNETDAPWPGMDVDPEGLLHVAWRWDDGKGGATLLGADVPASGVVRAALHLPCPSRGSASQASRVVGEAWLVQRLGGRDVELAAGRARLELDRPAD